MMTSRLHISLGALARTGVIALLLAPLGLAAQAVDGDVTPYSDGWIVSSVSSLTPGATVRLGLRIEMDEGWHTYWKNAGDSGSEALLDWNLPDGFEASEFYWPFPTALPYPPLMSYVYEDLVLIPLDLTVPADAPVGGVVRLAADAEWLICEEICLVAEDSLFLELPVTAGPDAPSEYAAEFAEAEWALPAEATGWTLGARADTTAGIVGVGVDPGETWSGSLRGAYFFPLDGTLIDHTAPQPLAVGADASWLRLDRSPYSLELPERLEGVLLLAEGETFGPEARRAVAVDVEMQTGRVPEAPLVATDAASGGAELSLLTALGLAMLGGLLLNLMPCVFPVLSLKILGFVEHAGGDRKVLRVHGLAFAAGVILSFLALAGTLIAFRAAGAEVGWGFQLQNPAVVTGLIFLMVAVGLNFLGVFEVGAAMTRLGAVGQDGSGYSSSFLTGVLATLVATPCTAPFMGAAVAAALLRPPVEGLTIFAGLGAGMALPYVILTFQPALLDRLPRPGRWMETLRQALAFPMFGVGVWLLWVLGLQVGMGGAAAVLTALLGFSLGAWMLHRAPMGVSTPGPRLARAGGVLLLVVSTLWGVGRFVGEADAATAAAAASASWEPFTAEIVAERRSEGRAVFVDFTAAWCITCQVNKRVALTDADVVTAFADRNVALVKADWTRRDDVIARELEKLGRNGVPVYALYPADPSLPPTLLPNVLTPGIVIDALDEVALVASSEASPATQEE